jgi:hypothetical protein
MNMILRRVMSCVDAAAVGIDSHRELKLNFGEATPLRYEPSSFVPVSTRLDHVFLNHAARFAALMGGGPLTGLVPDGDDEDDEGEEEEEEEEDDDDDEEGEDAFDVVDEYGESDGVEEGEGGEEEEGESEHGAEDEGEGGAAAGEAVPDGNEEPSASAPPIVAYYVY